MSMTFWIGAWICLTVLLTVGTVVAIIPWAKREYRRRLRRRAFRKAGMPPAPRRRHRVATVSSDGKRLVVIRKGIRSRRPPQ